MDQASDRLRGIAALCGVPAIAALALWFASWTGAHSLVVWPADLLLTLFTSLPVTMAWLLAACGFGWPLRLWLLRASQDGGVLQVGLGVAAMLICDTALGALGILDAGSGAVAYITVALGISLLIAQFIRHARATRGVVNPRYPDVVFWCAAPAIAAILVAACSAPGWLWESEFGGYDALSYHLQLPREWMTMGAIQPLDHNVYSFLPGYVEAAYYHLAILRGDAIQSASAAQLLHAIVAIAAACATGRIVARAAGDATVGALAAVVVLGTPWTIVAGSLAYNEMFVVLFLACGILVAMDERICLRERGVAIGLLAGAAVGAKLTALGFMVIPLAVFMIAMMNPRQWLIAGSFAAGACIVVLLPYLIRNYTAAGNPLFPFATELFGRAHWTAEQAAAWNQGHLANASIPQRLLAMWNQLLRLGFGPAPDPTEPWKPQWSILFWLGAAGAAAAVIRKPRPACVTGLVFVVVIQLVFWLFLTHLQSRFMLPAVIPLAALALLGACPLLDRPPASAARAVALTSVVIAIVWSLQPALLFAKENNGAPAARIGLIELMTGEMHAQELSRTMDEGERRGLLASAEPPVYLNALLPAGSHTLLIGDATPYYYTGPHTYQTTWDRGPMSAALRASDDPARILAKLRSRGFTHVLVDLGMLERWERSGWNDPLITAGRMLPVLDAGAMLLRAWDEGAVRLYEIRAQ